MQDFKVRVIAGEEVSISGNVFDFRQSLNLEEEFEEESIRSLQTVLSLSIGETLMQLMLLNVIVNAELQRDIIKMYLHSIECSKLHHLHLLSHRKQSADVIPSKLVTNYIYVLIHSIFSFIRIIYK